MNTKPTHTLTQLWELDLQTEAAHAIAPRTIQAYRTALAHWNAATGDPPILEITSGHVAQLRDYLLQRVSPATAQKQWRHLNKLLRLSHLHGLVAHRPTPSVWTTGNLLPKNLRNVRQPKRPPVTAAEFARLCDACDAATYPACSSAAHQWRILLYLFWMYGIRTLDVLTLPITVRVDSGAILPTIDCEQNVLRFRAQKTGKLQSLPITATGLRMFETLEPSATRWFPRFVRVGCWLAAKRRWETGYRTTWNREICPAAHVLPRTGDPDWITTITADNPGFSAHIDFKNLRQTAVTEYNTLGDGTGRRLGAWIAGHSLRDVDEQHYDQPTAAIAAAIAQREAATLPARFRTL